MAKRTAIIDIGSNSVRMAIFERTSRFGFFLINESKVRIRLGENAYENGGFIGDEAMQKTLNALEYFKQIAKNHNCDRFYCVGTSALRDAPNAKIFINLAKKQLNLQIKCIDGASEAKFGAIAALNLLSPIQNATTIDIGGGSTELALIKDGKICECISLNVGTVRLKEMFFDKNDVNGAAKFIGEICAQIPKHFCNKIIIAIGGSLRCISNAIMEMTNYPLKTIHNFSYELQDYDKFISDLIAAPMEKLDFFHIKQDRFDTIREGAMIFAKIAKLLKSTQIHTSGVGVREGVFLDKILGKFHKFPANFNPSLRSLQDRFLERKDAQICQFCKAIFNQLRPLHNIDEKYLLELTIAAKLHNIGNYLSFYLGHANSAYFVLNALNYGYTHIQKVLIAMIIKNHGKKNIDKSDILVYKSLMPDEKIIVWLSFILALAKILSIMQTKDVKFEFSNQTLHIANFKKSNLLKSEIKKLQIPANFAISFN